MGQMSINSERSMHYFSRSENVRCLVFRSKLPVPYTSHWYREVLMAVLIIIQYARLAELMASGWSWNRLVGDEIKQM